MSNIAKLLREKVEKFRFSRVIRGVREIRTGARYTNVDAQAVVVSQVHHAAVEMAIAALKSFSMYYPYARLELINDGSLTEEDIALLNDQLSPSCIIDTQDIETGCAPRGNCWERLCYIANRAIEAYVIQVDSDTLTVGVMPEVYEAAEHNRSFTISEPLWTTRVPVSYLSDIQAASLHSHIQTKSERLLASYGGAPTTYIRGCAAFAGFKRQPHLFERLQELSKYYEASLGADVWNQWGSEQFASNVLISMDDSSFALPWPKYQNYGLPSYNGEVSDNVALMHFIGTKRFSDSTYRKLTGRLLAADRIRMNDF